MSIDKRHAYLISCTALGLEADFESFEGATGYADVEALWLRNLLLGLPLARDHHSEIGELHEHYKPLVPPSDGPAAVTPYGVSIRHACIVGALDLSGCGTADRPLPALTCRDCHFRDTDEIEVGTDANKVSTSLNLSHAHLARLSLQGSRLTHLRGIGMKVDVAVDISRIEPLDDFREQKWPGVEPGVFIRETEGQAKARQEGIDKGVPHYLALRLSPRNSKHARTVTGLLRRANIAGVICRDP